MANYTIKRGDTLSQISKNTGVSVSDLAKANGISDPNKIRAGATLTIPGQSGGGGSSSGTGYPGGGQSGYSSSGQSSYPGAGSGYSGGGYGGSTGGGQSAGYQPVTNYANGKAYQGIEKVGTAYNPQTGHLEHSSGYKGQAYQGTNGRYYTPEGSLIREDDYLYPEGAKISPNGMYFDSGSGWQLAKYQTEGVPGLGGWSHLIKDDLYGLAPGTSVGKFGGESFGGGSGGGAGGSAGGGGTTGDVPSTPTPDTPAIPSTAEIETYLNQYQGLGGTADMNDKIYKELLELFANDKQTGG